MLVPGDVGQIAELAGMVAAAGGLDHSDQGIGPEEIPPRDGHIVHYRGLTLLVSGLQSAGGGIFKQLGPDVFGLADDNGVGVLEAFLRHQAGVHAADDDFGALLAESIREVKGSLRGESGGGDSHQVEVPVVGDFVPVMVHDRHVVSLRKGGQNTEVQRLEGNMRQEAVHAVLDEPARLEQENPHDYRLPRKVLSQALKLSSVTPSRPWTPKMSRQGRFWAR